MAEKQGHEVLTLDEHGLLPPGIHDLSLDQIDALFGGFQLSERRMNLVKRLRDMVAQLGGLSFARHLIVDGSFVTSKPEPSDIDMVFVVASGTLPVTSPINPFEYNALSARRLKKAYQFDVFVVPEESEAYDHYVSFFARLKDGPAGVTKGLVRLALP
jgi:hypothetical protein